MSLSLDQAMQLKRGDVVTIDGVKEADGVTLSLWRVSEAKTGKPGTICHLTSSTHGNAVLTSALLSRVSMTQTVVTELPALEPEVNVEGGSEQLVESEPESALLAAEAKPARARRSHK